ncbi:DUF2997 domain-containing protein [Anabaena azotica]|uniref:DUF2997 domain-containing protein n=1 Tax=Anabaena azotica FACHB-119 TaxID=947527 RepID=A0ABR8DEM1_9NOST|nr:DUF2997 domain-containing protein [Anabaena azotica]MBD2505637.1 DUF2997 domain-containing protein [Anabaena azotica FACHB-119]
MERSVLIHFDNQTGEVRVEAEGYEGKSCLAATEQIEEALGVVSDRTFKSEAQTQQIRTNGNHQTRLRQ